MLFSTVLPFAVAVSAFHHLPNRDRRWGCRNADCATVPPPRVVRGVVSARDDQCRYTCYLKRLADAQQERQASPKAAEPAVVTIAEPSEQEAREYEEEAEVAQTLNINEAGSAVAALLSGNANNLKRRAAGDGPAAPVAPVGQFDVAVTSIPRRSEGLCKFAIDVLPNADDATPAISCRAAGEQLLNGMNRATAGLLAARLAQEYDHNCPLTAKTAYHVKGQSDASFAVFQRDDNTKSRQTVLGQKREVFFLDCGAVFINQPVSGFSGTGTAAQIKMIRDSRGLMPLMAESFPAEVFTPSKEGGEQFSADAPPPWLKEAESGI